MLEPTISIVDRLAAARYDLPKLRKQLDAPLARLGAEHRMNGGKSITHMMPWTSPSKDNWLVLFHYSTERVRVHTLLWFLDVEGNAAAIWTGASGMAYHIQADAIASYAERFDPTADALERVQSFFLDNPFFEMQVERPQGQHHWDVSVGMHQGLGLGVWDATTDIVHVRSFVPLTDVMEPGAPQDALRSPFDGLSLQQRIELADRAAEEERRQRAA